MKRNQESWNRCECCFENYDLRLESCPFCGYGGILKPRADVLGALPIGRQVGTYLTGMTIRHTEERITYLAWDTEQQKKVLLTELYAADMMTRMPDGTIQWNAEGHEEKMNEIRAGFEKAYRNTFEQNNTLYAVEKYSKRAVRQSADVPDYDTEIRTWQGKRQNQEDAADCQVGAGFIYGILCDGMGGLNGGEIASAACIQKMKEISESLSLCEESMIPVLLENQIREADRAVSFQQTPEGTVLNGGTTLLCAIVRNDRLFLASVGDSRIYLIGNDMIMQMTAEHNLLADLMMKVNSGHMARWEAEANPKKEALTSYVGIGDISRIDLSRTGTALTSGDVVLLCSDGLYRALDNEKIMEIIHSSNNTNEVADHLMTAIQEQDCPGQDNTTFILIRKN